MSADLTAEGELRRLERNRYFDGKLMTTRDMQAEQEYHRARLDLFARTATGTGVLSGLAATVEATSDGLEVVVEPGVAIDHAGRLVVVPETETRRLPDERPDGDVVYLYLTYAENYDERMPKPRGEAVIGSDTGDDCDYNRVLETFEVSLSESPPKNAAGVIPEIEFPSRDDLRSDETAALGAVARSYRENAPDRDDEAALLLGAFEPGSWTRLADATAGRPLVYDNDMLYAALVRHVTDFDNPHAVAGGGGFDGSGISPDEVREIVDAELGAVRDRADALEGYVVHRSLLETHETFVGVERTFGDHRIGDLAEEVVEATARALDDSTFDDEASYRAFLDEMTDLETEIAEVIDEEERSSEETRERYRSAVENLRNELDGDASVLAVVIGQETVCEAAELLERPVNV